MTERRQTRVGSETSSRRELVYFSDCILSDRQPEPSGEEGMQDVRIVRAFYRSAQTGRSIAIPQFEEAKQADVAAAHDTSGRQEGGVGQSAGRQRD